MDSQHALNIENLVASVSSDRLLGSFFQRRTVEKGPTLVGEGDQSSTGCYYSIQHVLLTLKKTMRVTVIIIASHKLYCLRSKDRTTLLCLVVQIYHRLALTERDVRASFACLIPHRNIYQLLPTLKNMIRTVRTQTMRSTVHRKSISQLILRMIFISSKINI
jgi:hypothetical protein